MAETCAFIKENGKRCGAYPPTGAKYCLWHDPDRVEEARKARMKGAYNAVNKPLPPSDVPELTPEDEVDLVIPVLQRAVRQLEEMRPSPSTMATLGSVASALDRALERRASRGADITQIRVTYVNDWRGAS